MIRRSLAIGARLLLLLLCVGAGGVAPAHAQGTMRQLSSVEKKLPPDAAQMLIRPYSNGIFFENRGGYLWRMDFGWREATGRFRVLRAYDGALRFSVPSPDRAGFRLQASGDPAPFLATVAAARGEFLVVESRERPGEREYVAVYDFSPSDAAALVECARANVK